MNKKNFRFKLVLVSFSLVFALLTVEIVLRVMNYSPYLINTEIFVPNDNELLPYKLKPDYHGSYLIFQDKTVTIDSDGYRVVTPDIDSDFPSNSENESEIILILGDSVAFGHGLSDNQTIASQMQSIINTGGMNYEVKNIAVTGYTPWNEYEALKEYLENNKADIVLLFYTVKDITLDNNNLKILEYESQGRFNPVSEFLYRNLYTYSLLTEYKAVLAPTLLKMSHIFNNEEADARINRAKVYKKALNYSMEALERINEMCQACGIEFYVVLPRFHTGSGSGHNYYTAADELIEGKLDERGLKKIVLDSHLRKLTKLQHGIAFNDPHPSALAVKSYTDELLDKLQIK